MPETPQPTVRRTPPPGGHLGKRRANGGPVQWTRQGPVGSDQVSDPTPLRPWRDDGTVTKAPTSPVEAVVYFSDPERSFSFSKTLRGATA